MKTIAEFQKLKRLLFDKQQYFLFEHIPKPILFDAQQLEHELEENYGIDTKEAKEILENNRLFWKALRGQEEEKGSQEFARVLQTIKKKERHNIIDERLIKIINELGGKY